MFTFGREHEKAAAASHVADPTQLPRLHSLIDAIHDLLEGRFGPDALRPGVADAFINGGSGVWEQAGGWLAKLSGDYPMLQNLWQEFASDKSAQTRFRAAAFIADMPHAVGFEIGCRLLLDKSTRVRAKAASELGALRLPAAAASLKAALSGEREAAVIDSIRYALDQLASSRR